ncbi:DUF3999 domain-containing protein [SAR202 cluster bacterium AC-409-J13_OGT_754m]|nr:DUF3999 domain-containing protein [SAR202 cluster bacterium AC-409-J13_OGT_754m]
MFRLMGVLIVVIALVQANSGYVSADFELENWEFYKALSLPLEMEAEEFVEVYPDRDLYANSKADFDDLRIIDSQSNAETPYKIVVLKGADANQELDANVSGLGFVLTKGSSFTFQLKYENSLHNQLVVVTASDEFLASVKVEASFDGKTWELLKDPVFLYRLKPQGQHNGLFNLTIDYPENSAPLIRVVVNDVNLGDLKIDGAKIAIRDEVKPDYIEYSYSVLSRSSVAGSSDNMLVIDMGVIGLPTSRIEFEVEETNFYRDLLIEGSDDGMAWTSLMGNFVLSSYDTPKLVAENMIIDYPEVANRYIRVLLVNQDNAPLSIENIQIFGYSRTLIMNADRGSSYLIYYGNLQALAPSYDINRIYPYLETNKLQNARMGAQTTNLSFKPYAPWYDRYPWLVTAVVVISTLLLGIVLVRIFRDVVRSSR